MTREWHTKRETQRVCERERERERERVSERERDLFKNDSRSGERSTANVTNKLYIIHYARAYIASNELKASCTRAALELYNLFWTKLQKSET